MAMIVLARLLTQLRRFIARSVSVSVSVPADRSQESREFGQGGSKVGAVAARVGGGQLPADSEGFLSDR
jgi:hypothetical protein